MPTPGESSGDSAVSAQPGARLRVVFLGTSGFAEPVLRALAVEHSVLAVATQPARPAGRRHRPRPSRISRIAGELGLPVMEPERIRRRAEWEPIAALEPDALVVADYGQILPAALLEVPRLGAVNVHASLLPELRGAAPAFWAVARRFRRTGVTTMLMDAGLDTGPILLQRETDIGAEETGRDLLDRLAPAGAELLIKTLAGLADGSIEPRVQNDEDATHAPRIGKADTVLDWNRSAEELAALVRAFSPAPATFTALAPSADRNEDAPTVLKIHTASVGNESDAKLEQPPGAFTVSGSTGQPRLLVRCAENTVFLPTVVQAPGRRPLAIADFLRGKRELFGESGHFLNANEALEAAGVNTSEDVR